jgi:hypothetical protein
MSFGLRNIKPDLAIKRLADVTENATCASDLEAVSEIVGRLRLDGRVMDIANFEALVLRGHIAAPPRQLDWRDFQRPPKSGRRCD